LFFYGWNSYIVFKDGTAIARGEWDGQLDRVEVSFNDRAIVR
jgi:hypothetical protein